MAKVCGFGELRVGEGCISSELRILEVCVSGELRIPEECGSGEFRAIEVCFIIESGGYKIALFNGEVVQGVENWCSAKVEPKGAPCAGGNGYLHVLIHADFAATLAQFFKNGTAYVLLFMKCYLKCRDVIGLLIFRRVLKTLT